MFDQKVELNSSFEGLYVGYCYKQKSNNYPIGVNSKVDGPFFVYANIPSSQGGNGETGTSSKAAAWVSLSSSSWRATSRQTL